MSRWALFDAYSLINGNTFNFINIGTILEKYFKFITPTKKQKTKSSKIKKPKEYKEPKTTCLFLVIPIFISIGTSIQKPLDNNFVDTIIVFLSILMAMFFGFITYFADYSTEKHLPSDADAHMQETLKITVSETKMLSAYEIVITFIAIIMCLIHLVFFTLGYQVIVIIVSAFIYFFILHICLNLFVILKRFSIVFNIKQNHSD